MGGAAFGKGEEDVKQTHWSEDMPEAIMFPANRQSSRADALILDKWITKALLTYGRRSRELWSSYTDGLGCGSGIFGSRGEFDNGAAHHETRDDSKDALSADKDLTRAVEELVPILSIGLHEIVRQVTQHCLQRGVVLEKIWRTYVELFEQALSQSRASLQRQRQKTNKMKAELERTERELHDLHGRQPEQIGQLSGTLEKKFVVRQQELEEQLKSTKDENAFLQNHLQERRISVQSWFPRYETYKDSVLKGVLDGVPVHNPSNSNAESRIAADYKRIISAMPPESRRRVGFFISSLLGLRGNQSAQDVEESLEERKTHNAFKITQLEDRLEELKALSPAPSQAAAAEVGKAKTASSDDVENDSDGVE
jgi:hypothetical protein